MENQTHHRGLIVLFFTEMWERFSYYGMRALLVLYLSKHLGFSDLAAGQVYGAYTALVYLTPLLGGYLADKYLGNRNATYLGGILMMLGHFSLAFDKLSFFYLGLGFLILGNGFFKPNISTMVGRLYEDRPWMRESAYTYFYMGINIGGSFGPLLCGYIGETFGWHLGFGLAGLGMLLGLLQFKLGEKLLGKVGIGVNYKNLDQNSSINSLLPEEKKRVIFIFIISFFSIFFWVPYEQMGSSVNLYTDRMVDRVLFGQEIPASVFQSINGFLILAFAPITAWFWKFLHNKNLELSIPAKFILSFLLLGLSHLFLYMGEIQATQKANILYLLVYYILLTLGELCISPVGLSTVAKVAPEKLASFLMGIWFLSNAISHYLSGWLSGAYSKWFVVHEFFLFLSFLSFLAIILLLFIKKFIKNLIPSGGIQ